MYTLMRSGKTDDIEVEVEVDLDLDALQDELEFQEFHLGLFAEY